MSIAILTPSRGRPKQLQEMLDAIYGTCAELGQVCVYVGLDDDDADQYTHPGITAQEIVIRQRMPLAPWTNLLAKHAISDGHAIIGFLGDDHRPRTYGWDVEIERAMWNRPGLVYGDDLLQGENLPTAPFWHRDVIDELGFYYPPELMHLFADDYWLKLARRCECATYLAGIVIEHMHWSIGKAEVDESYIQSDGNWARDQQAYIELVGSARFRDQVERVNRRLYGE